MSAQNRPPNKNQPEKKFQQVFRNFFFPAVFILIILYVVFSGINTTGNEIDYSKFKDLVSEGQITSVTLSKTVIEGVKKDKSRFTTTRVDDQQLIPLLESKHVDYKAENRNYGITQFLFTWILPF